MGYIIHNTVQTVLNEILNDNAFHATYNILLMRLLAYLLLEKKIQNMKIKRIFNTNTKDSYFREIS